MKSFQRKCPPASSKNPNPPRIYPTEVICTEVDKSQLPIVKNNCKFILLSRSSTILTSSACRSICKIESDFSSLPLSLFKLKNRHWWNSGPKYHRINYVVKVNLGPADVSFELWHNGVKLSKDNSIKVEWQASAPPDPNATTIAPDFPMNSLPAVPTYDAAHRRTVRSVGDGGGRFGTNWGKWENKTGVRSQVMSASHNGSRVW